MATYHLNCETCGSEFASARSTGQPPPRFCSRACFGASLSPSPLVVHSVVCRQCGAAFVAKRAASAPPPVVCSRACYDTERSTRGVERKAKVVRRYRTVSRKVDGVIVKMQRSHWVWNENHPGDPVMPGEYVHHIDHNPNNDEPSNLQKLTVEAHQSHHAGLTSADERSRRMKAYHAANPGAHRKGEPGVCPVCGVEFYRPPSAKAQTCSYACMGKLRTMKSTT